MNFCIPTYKLEGYYLLKVQIFSTKGNTRYRKDGEVLGNIGKMTSFSCLVSLVYLNSDTKVTENNNQQTMTSTSTTVTF